MKIREANEADLEGIARVYRSCFPGEVDHESWIHSTFASHPRAVYYVVTMDGDICGYILWCVKNGFREECIVELEQIGVHPDAAGQGLGRALIEQSIAEFQRHIEALGYRIGAILVTTSEGNFAERLYESTLGVTRSAKIANYGSGTELILYRHSVHQA